MEATITTKGKIEIDLAELAESLSDDDRLLFAQSVVFQEALLSAVVDTLVAGQAFDGWYIGDMDQRLRMKLLPLLPEAVQALVQRLVKERDRAKADREQFRDLLNRIERHWPREVEKKNECSALKPEHCVCAWSQSEVAALLDHEIGEDWRKQCEASANA